MACWYSEVDGLNRFFHVWPYRDLAEQERVRQENKLLIPAAFSPLK